MHKNLSLSPSICPTLSLYLRRKRRVMSLKSCCYRSSCVVMRVTVIRIVHSEFGTLPSNLNLYKNLSSYIFNNLNPHFVNLKLKT